MNYMSWRFTDPTYRTPEQKYEEREQVLEAALKPKLTAEFLITLADAVRTCGWSVDMIESARFVEWCFELAGVTIPELEPFQNP